MMPIAKNPVKMYDNRINHTDIREGRNNGRREYKAGHR